MKRLLGLMLIPFVLVLASVCVHASDPVKTEVDGTWKLTQYNEGGKDNQEIVKSKFTVIREDGRQAITMDGKKWRKALYSVNSDATPKEITWRNAKDETVFLLGIYEINGDTVKVAVLADKARSITDRPKDFHAEEGKVIATYQRIKEQ